MIIAPRRASAIMRAPASAGRGAGPPGVPSARMQPRGPMKRMFTAANCNGARATRTRRVRLGMRRQVVTMNQSMLTPTSQCSSATYQTDPRRRSIAPNTSPAGPAAQASFSARPKCAVTDSAVCTRLDDVSPNLVQTALSVTAHFGRALNEACAAGPAGLVFGAIDLRLGSVWYVALLHWLVGVSMDWFIVTT